MAFAHMHDCLFVETSAKSGAAVSTMFEEVALRVGQMPADAPLAKAAVWPRDMPLWGGGG